MQFFKMYRTQCMHISKSSIQLYVSDKIILYSTSKRYILCTLFLYITSVRKNLQLYNHTVAIKATCLCAYTCTEYTLYSLQTFKEMRIPQIRDPSLPPLESLPESYQAKVTVYRVLHVAATAYSSALISRHPCRHWNLSLYVQ